MAPTPGLDGNFHHCRLPSPSALSQIHSTSQAQTGSDDGLGSNCCNQALALKTGSMSVKAMLRQPWHRNRLTGLRSSQTCKTMNPHETTQRSDPDGHLDV